WPPGGTNSSQAGVKAACRSAAGARTRQNTTPVGNAKGGRATLRLPLPRASKVAIGDRHVRSAQISNRALGGPSQRNSGRRAPARDPEIGAISRAAGRAGAVSAEVTSSVAGDDP